MLGVKHNPWGDGVKGQAIYTSDGHFSRMIMSANRPKTDTSPRIPVGQVIAYWGTYTVDEEAKPITEKFERCTFPQWDGNEWTNNIAFPSVDEFQYTFPKPFPDPTLGPIAPHIYFKRAK
jgi:hypothetical protein